MQGFLVRMLITAAGLWLADALLAGVTIAGVWTLVGAALLLGIVNAIVRPIAILLTLPVTLLTLGAFLLVINAAMLGLVARLLPAFSLATFWTAVAASIIVSLTSCIASWTIGPRGRFEVIVRRRH